jgi:hypothetical protein
MISSILYSDPATDPNRDNSEPHWRIYEFADSELDVVCVQDFDYRDYTSGRFITDHAFDSMEEAEAALTLLYQEMRIIISLNEYHHRKARQ